MVSFPQAPPSLCAPHQLLPSPAQQRSEAFASLSSLPARLK